MDQAPPELVDRSADEVWALVGFMVGEVLPECIVRADGVPDAWSHHWCTRLAAAHGRDELGGAVDALRQALRAEVGNTTGAWQAAAWPLHRVAVDVQSALWCLTRSDEAYGRRSMAWLSCTGALREVHGALAGSQVGLVATLVCQGASLDGARRAVRAATS